MNSNSRDLVVRTPTKSSPQFVETVVVRWLARDPGPGRCGGRPPVLGEAPLPGRAVARLKRVGWKTSCDVNGPKPREAFAFQSRSTCWAGVEQP